MNSLSDYLVFKAQKMVELKERLATAEQPGIPLTATARVAGGSGVRPVRVREFTVVTDSGPAMAGYDLGPTAPELLLSSLASCVAHTFLLVAASRQVSYDSLEVVVTGIIDFRGVLEVGEGTPIPPQNIRYEARIASDASADELAAIEREVERLCPVLQAFTQPMQVEGKVVIV